MFWALVRPVLGGKEPVFGFLVLVLTSWPLTFISVSLQIRKPAEVFSLASIFFKKSVRVSFFLLLFFKIRIYYSNKRERLLLTIACYNLSVFFLKKHNVIENYLLKKIS